MEILKFNARLYMMLSRLAQLAPSLAKVPDWPGSDILGKLQKVSIPEIRKECQSAGFDLAVKQADKIIGAEAKDVLRLIEELNTRIYEYLESRTVFLIPPGQRDRYEHPQKGWEAVVEKFPSVVDHIEEANRCFSLGRNTGCVHHLMAIVQEALEALSRRLSISLDPHTDTWNGLLNKIESAIKAKQATTPKAKWKPIEPFYAEIVSDLRAIKNAWRNPTMHFRRTYSDEQAEKIYARVQEFMIHAATRLRGRKITR